MSSLKRLRAYLSEMESYVERFAIENTEISKASVGWHIDHNLKVINNVVMALQASNPDDYKNNVSFLGKMFLKLRYFPRGKAKAPKYVRPPEQILKKDLLSQIASAKKHIETITDLNENAYFKHPLFGNINKERVSRFLETHTNHHLKIVREILK